MAEEKKKGAEMQTAGPAAVTPADYRSEVARDRVERLAKHIAASDKWSKAFEGPGEPEKPSILVLLATNRGGPVKVNGRVFPSHEQALVTRRELRMLTGLSRRGVCQLIVGKVKLAGKE